MNPFHPIDTILHRHRADQIDFLQTLVRANSANPFTPETSDPTAPIEYEVAHLIAGKLHDIGLTPELLGKTDARPNVLAVIKGHASSKSLILNGHMDTVSPSPLWTTDPFGAQIENNRLTGLGALDMKASLTMFVFIAQAILEAGIELAGDLILPFAVDEEPGGCSPFGTTYLLEHSLTATAAIVAEPENTNVTIGHRGGYRFKLTVRGEAAHTGLLDWERRTKGHNAISDMARVVQVLENVDLPYTVTPAFPDRKPVFTFPTLIQGGTGINAVPDECTAYGDVRLLPGCDAAQVEQIIHARLQSIPGLSYHLDRLLSVPAVEIDQHAEIVQLLIRHTAAITGQTPTTLGCGPWNDGWMFISRGIPAVCGFGPNGSGVHAPGEYVELDSLFDSTRILARAVLDYLGVVL